MVDHLYPHIVNHLVPVFVDNLKKYVIPNLNDEEAKDNDDNANNDDTDIQRALHATFKIIDEKILKWIGSMKSEGATCTFVYFHNATVFVQMLVIQKLY